MSRLYDAWDRATRGRESCTYRAAFVETGEKGAYRFPIGTHSPLTHSSTVQNRKKCWARFLLLENHDQIRTPAVRVGVEQGVFGQDQLHWQTTNMKRGSLMTISAAAAAAALMEKTRCPRNALATLLAQVFCASLTPSLPYMPSLSLSLSLSLSHKAQRCVTFVRGSRR